MKMIEVKDLSFQYQRKGKLVLDKLNFSCEKGTVNVLIGLNGSGKTTLIKSNSGLVRKLRGNKGKRLFYRRITLIMPCIWIVMCYY